MNPFDKPLDILILYFFVPNPNIYNLKNHYKNVLNNMPYQKH